MSGNNLSLKAKEALRHIRNSVMHFGKIPSVRELMQLMNYKSPRSAMLLIEELIANGFLQRKDTKGLKLIKDLEDGDVTRTIAVPLVGSVPCGIPMLAHENIEAMIPVSVSLARPGSRYFLLRASGNSMDEAGINDGDLVLIKQQWAAENGQKVVALIDDEATIKEFQHFGNIVKLLPKSSDPKHVPIILTTDFKIQGVVVATIPKL